jgi:2-succinyl-5-enolpyruvyl-6-hydroxy-3-cyclohexene-1-carboxylate synthase
MTVNPALSVVNAFVAELYRAGVQNVCISPGSRSTPLTMAIVRHGQFRTWTLLDERSAGFFALGLARATRTPVALVCTSGTATANYLPAVMEARQSQVPLLVLTADRPPELHHVGSNQTIEQNDMYRPYVKWSLTMPVPSDQADLTRHARATAWRAVAHALSRPMGPVHLNWPFREPLVPPLADTPSDGTDLEAGGLEAWFPSEWAPSQRAMDHLERCMQGARRGLIVCGPQDEPAFAEAAVALAKRWNVPLLADPLSQIRSRAHSCEHVIDTYDLILRDRRHWDKLTPDVVLRFGGTPTSKVLGQFLQSCTEARQIVVTGETGWRDPFFTAASVVQADPTQVCEALSQRDLAPGPDAWLSTWTRAHAAVSSVVERFAQEGHWFEGGVFWELSSLLPDGATLFAGNSMPVRDMDDYFLKPQSHVRCLANRGVSGIDGVVSTALGVAASGSPTVLVIGDVSFFHDLNGLLAARKHNLNLTVILVNNDGGGIFSFLPQAAHPDTFPYFRTEHGLDFEHAVRMYGGQFVTVHNWEEFRRRVLNSLAEPGLHVIEVRTNTEENVRMHDEVHARVRAALEGLL